MDRPRPGKVDYRGRPRPGKVDYRMTDTRAKGLVEITVEPGGKVWLELYPPGQGPVRLPMTPEQARSLGQGLIDGASEAEQVVPDAGHSG